MSQKVVSTDENEERIWHVQRLWELSAGLPVEVAPLQEFASFLDSECYLGPEGLTFRRLAERVLRVREADLSYPIILAAEGWIMDGRTRLCKALAQGLHWHVASPAVHEPRTVPHPSRKGAVSDGEIPRPGSASAISRADRFPASVRALRFCQRRRTCGIRPP